MITYTARRVAIVAFMLALGGCIVSASQVTDLSAKTSDNPKLRSTTSVDIQKSVIDDFVKGGAQEVYALFSEAGMADQGQIIVEMTGEKKARLTIYEPGRKQPKAPIDISGAELTKFLDGVKIAKDLSDFPAEEGAATFDGVHFEYVHMRKSKNDQLKVIRRVNMTNPGVIEKAPDHERLIETFRALIRPYVGR